MRNSFGSLSSPQRIQLFYHLVITLAALAVAWAVFVGLLSLVSWWGVGLGTIVLVVFVLVKENKFRQRQAWIDAGCCGVCGYDLRKLPTTICPECGRDGAIDEPAWRRLQREHEAKFGRDTAALTGGVHLDDATVRKLLAKADTFNIDL